MTSRLASISRILPRRGGVVALLEAVDPRTVRLRDPSRLPRRSVVFAVSAGALVAGAAAIAASRLPAANVEHALETPATLVEHVIEDAMPARAVTEEPLSPSRAPPARHPRFHHMYYVFTELPPARVSAYPLASPPGIVVDLEGLPEPEEPAAALVGEDDRIRSVRRRVTPRGLRYIIGIETPVTRIEVEHEGQVVIVTPIR